MVVTRLIAPCLWRVLLTMLLVLMTMLRLLMMLRMLVAAMMLQMLMIIIMLRMMPSLLVMMPLTPPLPRLMILYCIPSTRRVFTLGHTL